MQIKQNEYVQHVDVCVVGMGVSSLALVRQLEQENTSYVVVSEKDFGIWEAIARQGDDFDLQSSIPVSAFSWWKAFDDDFPYHSASDYYTRLKADIAGGIEARIIRERATSYVEQADGTYAVYTNVDAAWEGPRVICNHLVITAGVSTSNQNITEMLDRAFRLQDKTVFIEGYGDTSLMLMARLMLGNNRVIIGTNHFQSLDKIQRPKGPFTEWIPLDLIEEHQNLEFNNHELTYDVFWHSGVAPYSRFWLSSLFRKKAGIDDLIPVEDYIRDDKPTSRQSLVTRRGVFNGFGFPGKYWPVDGYFTFYDDGYKEHMLKHRMLLNDPYYFMQMGLVKVVHSNRITWLTDNQCSIDGEIETIDEKFGINPAMPCPIQIERKDGQVWTYDYRSCLHGIWSAEQPNVYFLGTERPTAGSYAAAGEMQCALIHRLTMDKPFRQKMIENYDKTYQSWQHNHLNSGIGFEEIIHSQFSGATNQALSRLLGVQQRLWPSIFKGKLLEYMAGVVIPARYDKLTHVGKEYSEFVRKWNYPVGVNILARANYVYLFAANLIALGLFAGTPLILVLGLLLFIPIVQKLVKTTVHDTISYGLDAGAFEHLSLIFLACMGVNLAGFMTGVTLAGATTWGWITLLTGLPMALVAVGIDIVRSYRNERLLFNDVRDHHQFADRMQEYLAAVKEMEWYKQYSQEEDEKRAFTTAQEIRGNQRSNQAEEMSNGVVEDARELLGVR